MNKIIASMICEDRHPILNSIAVVILSMIELGTLAAIALALILIISTIVGTIFYGLQYIGLSIDAAVGGTLIGICIVVFAALSYSEKRQQIRDFCNRERK